jgi:hypothetical protein
MLYVGRNPRAVPKQSLNLTDRHSVLLAFGPIAFIPIKSADLQIHNSEKLYKCIYKYVGATQAFFMARGKTRLTSPLDFSRKVFIPQ